MIPDIAAALNIFLGTWADDHSLPLVLDNISTAPPDEMYLEAHDMPAAPQTLDMGLTCHVYTGIYQINVVAPAGTGSTQPRYIARQVAAQFTEGMSIAGDGFKVWIAALPAIYAGLYNPQKTHYSIPISILYRVDSTN